MSVYVGDFAMLRPLPVLRDEDGEYHCPMPVMNPTFTADDEEGPRVRAMCGEPLQLLWELFCPVPDYDGELPVMTVENAGGWAVWGHWALRCSNGHVLATSAETDHSEMSQPFDARHWFAEAGEGGK